MALVQSQEANPITGQDEHETLETLFQNVDLNLAETQARECYHTTGPGRPPRSPLGLLRAFIVMRMKENKVRRLGRVAVYALYSVLCHVLTREAAENIGRPVKALSPTFFNRDGGLLPAAVRCRLVWGRRGCMPFILWTGRKRCLRGVFSIRWCAWSNGEVCRSGWSFYGFACLVRGFVVDEFRDKPARVLGSLELRRALAIVKPISCALPPKKK